VFDALGSRRCYKKSWGVEQIFDFFIAERGRHFDPTVVDWILDNREQMLAIRQQFPD
jgi:response regulator RpfG family c-di-GMP phosphodiesterase